MTKGTSKEIIDTYINGSVEIATLLDRLMEEVQECNLGLSDLDHYLELEELTEAELVKLQILRKHILIERRKAKDNIRVIDQILPKQIEGRTTMDRYNFAVHNLAERVYSPKKVSLEEAVGRSS